MPQVHPTAVLDSRVELADDVVVGPYCVLDGRITVGPGSRLMHHVYLYGPLTIGLANVFYPNVAVGFAPQDRKFDAAAEGAGTVIGNENIFREGVTVHRATKDRPTTLGHRNYFMVNAHVAHDCVVGNDCMLANGALLGGHVEVQDSAILGGNSAVHQHCRVGRFAMLSGADAVSQDLPPFCVAYATKLVGSLNIIGLRRAGLGEHIRPLKKAFDIFYRSRLAKPTAIERILAECGDDPLCVEFVDFIRHSKRGITTYGGFMENAASPEPAPTI